ncbi:MAG: SusD/RagB family nutrient-binding outer membrane lipoprotein [Bacteroidaceae bacterium]|nr:SusD/RagB family nutrient-binding outer membrane lipoprotein [Bacteroidaceae bacterium]
MKTYKYLLAGVCSMFMFTGCLDEYQDLNTNPEQMGNADPVNVFTGATLNYNNSSRADLLYLYSGTMTYMQYLVGDGGASAGSYINPTNTANRTSPGTTLYSQYYNAFGLRLNNLLKNSIPSQANPEKYNDLKAIAQILMSHQQWLILDRFGAAPFTEAFKATEGIKTPQYDLYQKSLQEDGSPMYKVIDATVKEAVNLLKQSNADQVALGNGDFFYKGDIQKWIKFGNTLRVKMAQRLEKADKTFYESVIGEILTSANNVIDSHEASFIYWHPNDYNDNIDDIQGLTSGYVAAAAFVNYLEAYNDPRLPLLIRPNGFGLKNNNTTNDEWFETFVDNYPNWETEYAQFTDRYSGISANPDKSTEEVNRSEYLTVSYVDKDGIPGEMEIRMHSQVESRYFVKNGGDYGNQNMPTREIEDEKYKFDKEKIISYNPILTYPETCFMLAEIAVKKGAAVAGKDATTWMREGIKASMEQYKSWAQTSKVLAEETGSDTYNPMTDEKIDAYLAQPEFQTATLEKIVSQQWINLYRQPEEMWATWKRTGLPKFKDNPMPEDGVAFLETIQQADVTLVIPRRNVLPTPNTLNIDNFNAAVKLLLSDAKYGETKDLTEGRIWWDVE